MSWDAIVTAFAEGFSKRKFLEGDWGRLRDFWGKSWHFSDWNVLIVVLRGWNDKKSSLDVKADKYLDREDATKLQLKVKDKSREGEGERRRSRRRLEQAHRRQIKPGFCGVQAHRIHSLAQPNSPPDPYLLSLRPSGKLAVPENSAA